MSKQRDDRVRRRERDEPDELHSPVPWPITIFATVLIAWGASYYFQNTGYPVAAGDRRTPIQTQALNDIDGSVVYAGNCAACHQATGMGLSGVFPPLVGSSWVLENDGRLVQILLHGVQGELVVNGATYNGVMPAFPQLSDGELAAVLTYIRQSWGNAAADITVDQIADGRMLYPDRTNAWQGGAELDAAFPPSSD